MPLVRIDVLAGRGAEGLRALGDGVHPNDPGVHRTDGIVFVQITLNAGRTLEQKKSLYASIVRNVVARPGVRPEDVLVSLVEVPKENRSFGTGIARYAPRSIGTLDSP